ncbi:MAG: hypothetical protein K5853_06640 [Lachnospiraceae bacterium]|nr:hypothetical protein [Lachnospiraceae bacterium]
MITIDETNKDLYEAVIGDAAENIGRENIRALYDEDASDGIMWEIYTDEDEDRKLASIVWFCLHRDSEAILREFLDRCEEDGIDEIYGETPLSTDEDVLSALRDAGLEVTEGNSLTVTFTVEELTHTPFIKNTNVPDRISAISSLIPRHFRKGIAGCMYYGARGSVSDLASLPMSWFDGHYSSFVTMDGKPTGFLLVHKYPDDRYEVQLFFAYGADFQANLGFMIRRSILEAKHNLLSDTKVIMRLHSQQTRALFSKLFPDKKRDKVFVIKKK